MKTEKRHTAVAPTLRAEGSDPQAGNRLAGYAAKFNTEFALYDGCVETIAPGAFARTLREKPDVRALYNHDTSDLLARTSSGTLRLREDSTGLAFELDLPDTSAGRDVKVLVGRRDLTGCSFGFCVVREEMTKRGDGTMLRTLLDVELHEITCCAFPAYEETEVSLRADQRRSRKPRLDQLRRKVKLLTFMTGD